MHWQTVLFRTPTKAFAKRFMPSPPLHFRNYTTGNHINSIFEALPNGATRTAHAGDSSASGFNRSRGSRLENASERWGPFLISKIRRAGAVTGLGASCLRHHNVGDKASNCCQKALDYGRRDPLTEAQAKLCLKRWLYRGRDITDGPRARTDHISVDARKLLNGSETEAELETWVASLSSTS
eukprot:1522822-Amphidinium_carterae.1